MDKSLGWLILWLQLDWVSSKQEVTQSTEALNVRERDSVVVNCSYTDGALYSLQWFRQDPGQGLTFLLLIQSNQREQTGGRIKVSLDTATRQSVLYIAASQPSDSATYLCAGRLGGAANKLIFGAGTVLSVKPNITDPDPAVYQLKSPKSSKTSVCLFTDFDSEKKMPQSQEGTVIMSNGTVLDMRVMDSKSNGVLAWSNSTDFKCNSTFNEKFYSSSDFSCNATLIEKSFETDMNLNAHNLLVMGLRVLLLKVAGFNLFVTLRLWSR